MLAVGIAFFLWSYFGIRETLPPQVAPIAVSEVPLSPNVEVTPVPSPSPEVPTVLYVTRPELGDRVGTITLPTLDLSWPIYEGTTDAQLIKGVGHYVQSVLPGETDNTVLSGHRTTVFNRLGELKLDDLILVKTKAGTFTYKVNQFRIVNRTDRTVIVPTDTAVLTITTCYPFNQVGATTKAFIVTADLVTD
jgi:sortase A